MDAPLNSLRLTNETIGAGCGLKVAMTCMGYLQLRNRVVRDVVRIEGKTLIYNETTHMERTFWGLYKVISYVTVILPLIALLVVLCAQRYYALAPAVYPQECLTMMAQLRHETTQIINQRFRFFRISNDEVAAKNDQIANLSQQYVDLYKSKVDQEVTFQTANFLLTSTNENLLINDFNRLNAVNHLPTFGAANLSRDDLITYRDQMWTDRARFARSLTVIRECSIKFKQLLEEVRSSALKPIICDYMKQKYNKLIAEISRDVELFTDGRYEMIALLNSYLRVKIDELDTFYQQSMNRS